jgi:hypothetical protein
VYTFNSFCTLFLKVFKPEIKIVSRIDEMSLRRKPQTLVGHSNSH